MVVGVCILDIDLPASTSLKDKRQVIRSISARLRRQFNVSVAEIERQDARQTAVLAAVTVSSDRDYVHGLLTRVAKWVDTTRLDCVLVDYEIELI